MSVQLSVLKCNFRTLIALLHWPNPNLISRKPIRTEAHQEFSTLGPALDPRCCRTKLCPKLPIQQFDSPKAHAADSNFPFGVKGVPSSKREEPRRRPPSSSSPTPRPHLSMRPCPPARLASAVSVRGQPPLHCVGVLSVLPIRTQARSSHPTQILFNPDPTTLPPHRASAASVPPPPQLWCTWIRGTSSWSVPCSSSAPTPAPYDASTPISSPESSPASFRAFDLT